VGQIAIVAASPNLARSSNGVMRTLLSAGCDCVALAMSSAIETRMRLGKPGGGEPGWITSVMG